MSSCSEASPPAPSEDRSGAPAMVLELLSAVTAEVASIAREIVVLGDKLAADASGHGTGQVRTDMQMFDLIGQNAEAQARLLAEIVRSFAAGDEAGKAPLRAAIGSVPFHASRQRLYAVLEGASDGPAAVIADECDQETDWF